MIMRYSYTDARSWVTKEEVYEGEKDQAIEWTMVQKHNGTKAQGDINFVYQEICLEKN